MVIPHWHICGELAVIYSFNLSSCHNNFSNRLATCLTETYCSGQSTHINLSINWFQIQHLAKIYTLLIITFSVWTPAINFSYITGKLPLSSYLEWCTLIRIPFLMSYCRDISCHIDCNFDVVLCFLIFSN